MLNTIQTFFADANAVQNADNISITSVDLYFKAKPNRTTNESGIVAPGIVVGICTVDSSTGVVSLIQSTRKKYDEVYDSSTSDAVTSVYFDNPIIVQTNTTYGIIVLPEDGGYEIWTNLPGDRVTGTNTPSGGPTSNKSGQLYSFTGMTVSTPTNGQLKFSLSIAKFTESTASVDLVNKPYEFLTISNRVNTFTGGEKVFANTAILAGSIQTIANSNIVTGSGTTFTSITADQLIVISSGANNQVVRIGNVISDTSMTVSQPLRFTNANAQYRNGLVATVVNGDYVLNKVTLVDSTANASQYFTAGQLVTGEISQSNAVVQTVDNIPVDKFVGHIASTPTVSGTITTSYTLSFSNGSTYAVANTFSPLVNGQQQAQEKSKFFILSRSNEVRQSYLYTSNRSAVTKITLTSSNSFAAPVIKDRNTDIIVYQNQVSNTYLGTYANGVTYDSEVTYNGTAISKHITKKITFDAERKAEDLVVYASAYRPLGTHVRFYARLHNSDDSEPFDDKLWTPLEYKISKDLRSSVDKHDYIEYQLGLPQFPRTQLVTSGKFTTTNNSTIITGSGIIPSDVFAAGQSIKIYNELFPTNYVVTSVVSANTSALVVKQPVLEGSIIGSGQKIDILEFGQVAYNNKNNYNISRYYNNAGAVFDKFNAVQVKIVLLADSTNVVPEVDQIEVIGVSA